MDKCKVAELCVGLVLALAAAGCERSAQMHSRTVIDREIGGAPDGLDSRHAPTEVVAAFAVLAATSDRSRLPGAGPVAAADGAFAAAAAASGLAEIEAGRLVADQTMNPEVKSYARELERDHASANAELTGIADAKDMTLPTTVTAESRNQLDMLEGAPPERRDRDFLQRFGVDAHSKVLALFERQARAGRDRELRAFAERTLPKLREHLGWAQQLQGRQAEPR